MPRIFLPILSASLLLLPLAAKSDTETAGDVVAVAIPATALAATWFYEPDREGTRQFFWSMGVSTATTVALKSAVHSRRPDGDCCDSFPSLHSSAAFAGAAFIEQRYGWKYGLPAYGAASFVAFSRVQSDRHRVSDVIAGAAIGVVSSHYFTTRYKGVDIAPVATANYFGVSIRARW